jgi:hypothetical protein
LIQIATPEKQVKQQQRISSINHLLLGVFIWHLGWRNRVIYGWKAEGPFGEFEYYENFSWLSMGRLCFMVQ